MRGILLRRIPLLLLTLFVSSILIFGASELLPINVARNILGQFATQEAVDTLNERLGLNRPPVERYVRWVGRVAVGDFGVSTSQQSRVGPLIVRHAINSGILALAALVVIIPVALLLGSIAGLYPTRVIDRVISFGSLASTSTPEFVIGVLLLLAFAVKLQILPGSSALLTESTVLQSPAKLVLPVLTLAIVDVGYLARMMRASMIEVMRSHHIRAARLRGLPFRRIVFKHALRNAMLTPIIVLMLHINWLVGGIVVTETVFGYPGLGQLMLTAANTRDVPLLEAGALFFALVAVLSQFLADLLYAWLNPRARAGLA
ncbi:MAG: peptide/nickel transport system permease protein [Rhodospirillaceae bacterium]|jgi:peptide/nickel transport system permease protein|nr:peptide/nickel transport system permease protein [Rhodospirillaceae bacterium]